MAYRLEFWCSQSGLVVFFPQKLAGRVIDICLWEIKKHHVISVNQVALVVYVLWLDSCCLIESVMYRMIVYTGVMAMTQCFPYGFSNENLFVSTGPEQGRIFCCAEDCGRVQPEKDAGLQNATGGVGQPGIFGRLYWDKQNIFPDSVIVWVLGHTQPDAVIFIILVRI